MSGPRAGSTLGCVDRVAQRTRGAVLGWLRRWSLEVLVALVGVVVVQAALGGTLLRGPAPLVAVALAAAGLGASLRVRASLVGWATASAGLTLANQLDSTTRFSSLNDLVFFAAIVGGAVVVGHLLGARAAQIRELHERTARLAAQQELVEAAARSEERSRIARAVHATIAQRIGEIALQAGGAERIAAVDGVRALEALGHVEAAARRSLDDIRDVIGVLRDTAVDERP
jgi:signal transduction histidine kinase